MQTDPYLCTAKIGFLYIRLISLQNYYNYNNTNNYYYYYYYYLLLLLLLWLHYPER
jgi:hypothetical protein